VRAPSRQGAVATLDAAQPLDEDDRVSEESATLRVGFSGLIQEYAHSLEGRSGRGWPPADRLVVRSWRGRL